VTIGRTLLAAGVALACSGVVAAAQEPAGLWNLKIRPDSQGPPVRTVLLKVEQADGKLRAQVSGLRNDLRPADKVAFESGSLVVEYGAYTYTLKLEGDELHGTVTSPTGTQHVDGARQKTLSFYGDAPPPLTKEWTGVLVPRSGPPPQGEADPVSWVKARAARAEDLVLWARRTPIEFTNASAFADVLMQQAGRTVTIAGTWKTDRIEIDQIKPAPPRP
jgi:hypothetical protein